MKKLTIKRIALRAILPLSIFASCDYLDVVPPEQPETKDTMTDATDAVNFISSCYIAVESCAPFVYSTYEWSADESVDPPTWEGKQRGIYGLLQMPPAIGMPIITITDIAICF